jgi:hypothetical protein
LQVVDHERAEVNGMVADTGFLFGFTCEFAVLEFADIDDFFAEGSHFKHVVNGANAEVGGSVGGNAGFMGMSAFLLAEGLLWSKAGFIGFEWPKIPPRDPKIRLRFLIIFLP